MARKLSRSFAKRRGWSHAFSCTGAREAYKRGGQGFRYSSVGAEAARGGAFRIYVSELIRRGQTQVCALQLFTHNNGYAITQTACMRSAVWAKLLSPCFQCCCTTERVYLSKDKEKTEHQARLLICLLKIVSSAGPYHIQSSSISSFGASYTPKISPKRRQTTATPCKCSLVNIKKLELIVTTTGHQA